MKKKVKLARCPVCKNSVQVVNQRLVKHALTSYGGTCSASGCVAEAGRKRKTTLVRCKICGRLIPAENGKLWAHSPAVDRTGHCDGSGAEA